MQNRLSPEWNVSYVDDTSPPAPLGLVFKHYFASAAIYGGLVLLLALNPWFTGLVRISIDGFKVFNLYFLAYLCYLAISLPVYLWFRPRSLWASKNLLVVGLFARGLRALACRIKGQPAVVAPISYKETHAVMFLLIKLFYGPLMLNSAFFEFNSCRKLYNQFDGHTLLGALDGSYIMFVCVVFLLDSLLFTVGYHSEARFLKNEVRYVETRPLHILVCIMCYAPFNEVTVQFLGPAFYAPYILVLGDFRSPWTWVLRAGAVFFLCLLLAASGSLFTRASNLTNRGIVTWGPYRYIRHPGYLAKNLYWLMTLIPLLIPDSDRLGFSWGNHLMFCFRTLCGFFAWGTIYYLRAITEERFLSRDPEYVEYMQRVKYRFIPGVW